MLSSFIIEDIEGLLLYLNWASSSLKNLSWLEGGVSFSAWAQYAGSTSILPLIEAISIS